MCYYKSLAQKETELLAHYAASFDSITAELEPIKARFESLYTKDEKLSSLSLRDSAEAIQQTLIAYSQKGALPAHYTKEELAELKLHFKTLSSLRDGGVYRYLENGFDYLPTPIVTAGDPTKFKLFRWGLIPPSTKELDKALAFRAKTLNCVSEEMYNTWSFRDAAHKAQRCLIPVNGFFEWRHLDEGGKMTIPYHVTFRDGNVRSMAGIYARWKNPETGEYYYSYAVLTTAANTILEYVHNSAKRMPVFIAKEDEKAWLDQSLKKEDVMALCRPSEDPSMRAYTISKLLNARNVVNNVPRVLEPMNYEAAIEGANKFLLAGDKKKALDIFKEIIGGGDKFKVEDLANAATQKIAAELG